MLTQLVEQWEKMPLQAQKKVEKRQNFSLLPKETFLQNTKSYGGEQEQQYFCKVCFPEIGPKIFKNYLNRIKGIEMTHFRKRAKNPII